MPKKKSNLVVTGTTAGKARFVHQLTTSYADRLGGIATEALMEGGEHKGVLVRRLGSRDRSVVAHVAFGGDGMLKLGRYHYNPKSMEAIAVPALKEAVRQRKLVVIDRISLMHVLAENFAGAVLGAFTSPCYTISVLDNCDDAFAREVRRRGDVEVVRLGEENWRHAEERVRHWLASHVR